MGGEAPKFVNDAVRVRAAHRGAWLLAETLDKTHVSHGQRDLFISRRIRILSFEIHSRLTFARLPCSFARAFNQSKSHLLYKTIEVTPLVGYQYPGWTIGCV
nr:AlNc14C8G1031 [Albugo laibachii Nc14]CCA23165.1 AlNc14C183G8264 [Albugo laibachii Nc14]|eukprot:CCA23165.1 AlNc14C183G8264 [Albugo laibachii Nc14]